MIVEFIRTTERVNRLKLLTLDNFESNNLKSVKEILDQLIHYHPFSSHLRWTKGSLTKLKEFSQVLSSHSSHQNKKHLNLHHFTQKALLDGLHAHELVHSLTLHPEGSKNITLQKTLAAKKILTTFQKRIHQVIRHFPGVMHTFWNDENVMLCLLRMRHSFDEIYGTDFLAKHLKCPVNAKELLEFLCQRYQERGFDSLLPTILQLDTQSKFS